MNESILTIAISGLLIAAALLAYLRRTRQKERLAAEAAARGELFSDGPKAQHPRIDVSCCIGCQGCTVVCPEGDVLGMIGGKAAILNGYKCIGHSLCAEACPVGAITMVMAKPGVTADLPYLSEQHETNLPNLFIAGELGGLALIKNAVNQGRDCIDVLAERLAGQPSADLDVVIVGAGPAGISASLRAIERGLSYVTLEQEEIGGTVSRYPRQKLVMTSPVEFPLHGKFRKLELSKEDLLEFWNRVGQRADMKVRTKVKVDEIARRDDGLFSIAATGAEGSLQFQSRGVVLAIGRAGSPRKLGIPGEDSPKVMYRLIEADHYKGKKILVVGGGDSAVEAALGLAMQAGNQVTLSYRGESFRRIKDRNAKRLAEASGDRALSVLLQSAPTEIHPDKVVLQTLDGVVELPNDYVWIFAGGVPPDEFLKKVGVRFGANDITAECAAAASAIAK